ncbi:hypothetical protein DXG01_010246 [Tephrocybe rancida]|nr:hypothetical protein DXG01_010246 [Tephrocybe rancida]
MDISAGTMWSAQIVYFDGPIHTLPESVMPLIQYNLPTLLEKADSALHFVDQQGRNLERMLFEPDVPAPHNVGVALQQYMRALEDANTDVYACAQVLQHFFNRVYPAEDSLLPHHILDFFTRLPLVNEHAYTVVFHGIEHLKGGKFHAIFTVPRVLADLRRRGVLPDLPELETPSFIPDHSLQRLHARYLHNPQNLYGDNDIMDREVLPISMCLTILSPTWRQSKIAVNFSKLKWHNDTFPWLNRQGGLESPALSLLPKLFNNIPGPVRPMKVFSYVMEDIEHDGKIMELASFICNVVFAPSESTAQMAFAKEALDILLKKWRLTYDSSWHDRPERAIPTRGQSTSAVVVNLSIPIPKFRRTKPTVVEEEEDGHSLHLCEGSQILLVGLVKHLLEIERSARDGSRPFPTFIVDVVASLVRQTLTKEVPIHIAEELFKLVPTASTTLTVRTEIVCARMHEEREVSTTFKLE